MMQPRSNFRPLSFYVCGILLATVQLAMAENAQAAKCLFVSSYHQGYEWSDGVERGVRQALEGKCELRQFDMDTKRQKSEEFKKRVALEAKRLIESWKPDVVITADDNAAKYLIKPYFKDSAVPFVFCGVNWSADEYGFPYSNVTGMVEVAPIRPMLERAADIAAPGRRVFYLGANTLSEEKNLRRFQSAASELGIELDSKLASTTADWLAGYASAQAYDFVVLGSNSGINDWDDERIRQELSRISTRLTVTNHGWMMPYTMFGLTKVPEEHGEWGAQAALAILGGERPIDIPIIANRKWDVWANESLLQVAGISLPRSLRAKAKRTQ